MEPMATNRQCLVWLRICSADGSATRRQKIAHTIFAVAVSIGMISLTGACLTFCWKFVSIEMGRSVFAFMVIVGQFTVIYMALVGMILLRHKIGAIFDNLKTIYKDNEEADSYRFLARANDTSEWMWKMYFKIIAVILIMNLAVAPLISVLLNWYTGKGFKVENLYHPTPMVLPWNQTTPIGYVAELTYHTPGGFAYFFVNGVFLLLFISICQHHQAFYKMFKHTMRKLKQSNDDEDEEKVPCDAKFLCGLIRFHISVKDWFLHTADVYSSFNADVYSSLIANEIMLATSIFYVDYQFQRDGFNVTSALSAALTGVINLFIYCYLGKMATESYAKMPDCVYYKIKWYELPIELQKHFILMIQNMQQPLYYHGFGVIHLDLETFRKFLKSAFTYYGIIKTLTETD